MKPPPSLRRPRRAAALALLALALAFPGYAVAQPFAFGEARRGSLQVVSGAFVAARSTDLRGVWIDESLGCNAWRSLRVNALIDYSRRGTTRRVQRTRTGAVRNCAEGGPNFGFTLSAARVGLACANGRWRPGSYTFVVRTTHVATGVQAMVSLAWDNRRSC